MTYFIVNTKTGHAVASCSARSTAEDILVAEMDAYANGKYDVNVHPAQWMDALATAPFHVTIEEPEK